MGGRLVARQVGRHAKMSYFPASAYVHLVKFMYLNDLPRQYNIPTFDLPGLLILWLVCRLVGNCHVWRSFEISLKHRVEFMSGVGSVQ